MFKSGCIYTELPIACLSFTNNLRLFIYISTWHILSFYILFFYSWGLHEGPFFPPTITSHRARRVRRLRSAILRHSRSSEKLVRRRSDLRRVSLPNSLSPSVLRVIILNIWMPIIQYNNINTQIYNDFSR